MKATKRTSVYIDGANLHRAAEDLGFAVDYHRFYKWLRQKYLTEDIHIFVGYIDKLVERYRYLQECGYQITFKKTVIYQGGGLKGNCDAGDGLDRRSAQQEMLHLAQTCRISSIDPR